MTDDIDQAKNKLIGKWANADDTILFSFPDPKANYNKDEVIYKIGNLKERAVGYFIAPLGNGKLKLHLTINFEPFSHGSFVLDFVGDDILELTYLADTFYTLLRVSG